MSWYMQVMKKYASFRGRARRAEYWWFTLVNSIIIGALLVVGSASNSDGTGGTLANIAGVASIIYVLYTLAVLLPSLAVTVRRLHDTDRTGLWLLVSLVPLVGPIVLLAFLVQEGNLRDNRYGPSPKETRDAPQLNPSSRTAEPATDAFPRMG